MTESTIGVYAEQTLNWLSVLVEPPTADGMSAARSMMVEIDSFLCDEGWPSPIISEAGNGFRLVYRLDLSSDENGLVSRCGVAIADLTDRSMIVTVTTMLVGPTGGKIIAEPESLEVVAIELLNKLANQTPIPRDDAPTAEQTAIPSEYLPIASPPCETTNLVNESWPAPIDLAAFYGVAGDIVRKIDPHTEADPVAVLIQLLTALGNMIGRMAFFRVEATRHYANLFSVIVGASSVSRKGTSGDQVTQVVRQVDEDWFGQRIFGGLVSGEGLIWQVRDPIIKQEAVREGGRKDGKVIEYQEVVADPGVDDKRLLVIESEFSSVLKVKSRDTNTLSEAIRQAWDSGRLRTVPKNQPAKATDAHISLIGHITAAELREVSSQTDLVNGWANRFLWCCVKRSKLLPNGGQVHLVSFDLEVAKLREAVEFASVEREVRRDAAADAEWHRLYPSLTADRPGAVGAICNRGAAQVVRLSLLYALLDCSTVVTLDHLHAALALWNYCEASVKYIFGNSLANRTADSILNALKGAGASGMSRSDISNLLGRNKPKAEVDAALQVLVSSKLARWETIQTGGRPAETWFATA